jgi:hypothetical protein
MDSKLAAVVRGKQQLVHTPAGLMQGPVQQLSEAETGAL